MLRNSALRRYSPLLACLVLAIWLVWWQPPRIISALLIVIAYAGVCLHLWRNHRTNLPALSTGELVAWIIGYASQGGQAQRYAEHTAKQLRQAGQTVRVCSLAHLAPQALTQAGHALFVVSTYGEGEAPDNGSHFARRLQGTDMSLGNLNYAVLALGDRRYRQFCAFGKRLDARLQALKARPLFDRVEVDGGDPGALRHWQQQLSLLVGHQPFSDWLEPGYGRWELLERHCLNPRSSGWPVFHLSLRALGCEQPTWRAGDIAEIGPRQPEARVAALLLELGLDANLVTPDGTSLSTALCSRQLPARGDALLGLPVADLLAALPPLAHREYSIASTPAQGTLQLLVRQMYAPDGTPGIGSGWLCQQAAPGDEIALRIRSNPAFHGPAGDTPLILIGNGTGIAGLMAHLHERADASIARNWLLLGERNEAHDAFFDEQLQRWLATGHLTRLDRVFSRDQPERRYVQHQLRDMADDLRDWLEAGAGIYLCGSLEGMGRDVHALLLSLLGQDAVTALTRDGRYRRDLY